MVKYTLTDSGFEFQCKISGRIVPFDEWHTTDDCMYYWPLKELVENGFALVEEDKCIVPFENVYAICPDDREIVGLPNAFDNFIRLRGNSVLNQSDFSYSVDLMTSVPGGKILPFERKGCVVVITGTEYLLTQAQYALLEEVDSFNRLSEREKSTDVNMRAFALVKELAKKAGCYLDSYLSNENVYAPDKIKVDIKQEEDGFIISPSLEMKDNEKFQNVFGRMRRVQKIYPVQAEDGSRTRVVFNEEQASSLGEIKEVYSKRKTKEEIDRIVKSPTEFFDPNVFDLSELYSDRVIEIGAYTPKFTPFISPYKSCWAAGAKVSTPGNGTANVMVFDDEDLETLAKAIASSESQRSDIVLYKDAEIAIDDARFLHRIAKRQLACSELPLEVEDPKSGRKVLVIKENTEEDELYSKNNNLQRQGEYILHVDDYLNPSFTLKEHQKEGVAWLQHLYEKEASGCLMADDMGLGKTLQILYFIDWHSRNYPNHNPYLIVAPVTLLENWKSEYERFFTKPRLSISTLTSREVPRKFNRDCVKKLQSSDIILTNYESLRSSQMNFCAVEYDIVAVDEAQKIKTPGTMVTNASKALNARFRIAMTGTPVENTLMDLWCIMDFCVPGLLGNAKTFSKQYHNKLSEADTDIVQMGEEIHERLGVYFMRRLKKDAAKDLPNKFEVKEKVQMPGVQVKSYQRVLDSYLSGEQDNMLLVIQDIKEISEHPYLFNKTLFNHSQDEIVDTSARLLATIPLLDDICSKGEKAIIFAERKDTQRMLQKLVFDRYKINSSIINGDTPTYQSSYNNGKLSRQACVDRFQSKEGFNIIIMSPIAAGMGLNVVAANHVIHYSRHWNPAKENQATDRAYRIGQTKDVFVYYPMAVSDSFKSFDETLNELLTRKSDLASSTIFPTDRAEVKQDELGKLLFTA